MATLRLMSPPRANNKSQPSMSAAPQQPRTALITGGTRGIGLGIAQCLARDGYNLVLGYNSNQQAADAARRHLQETYGVVVECVGGDISLASTMDSLFDCVESCFDSRLTAFIHNAGAWIRLTSISDCQPDPHDFEEAWRYYHAVYVLAFKRALNKALACQGLKHVVAISAQGCNMTRGPMLVYEPLGQGKAGLEYLARHYALKLAAAGINVNCIVPGAVETDAWAKLVPSEEKRVDMIKATPAKRFGTPEEIGEVAAFLCSDRASFLTGATIPVDGALSLAS